MSATVRAAAATILVVEDDEPIGHGLQDLLKDQGYGVVWTRTGAGALEAASNARHDLVLLDLGLPDMDGLDVCRSIRGHEPEATIVILTARVTEIDVVVGLDAGADDYVTKPFRTAELTARVRAHLRRRVLCGDTMAELTIGDVRIDVRARRVWVADIEITLRVKEFDLLAMLMSNAGRVMTRERIMTDVWDEHWFGSTKTLDMHISSLRRKLGDPAEAPVLITTLRGVGYRFEHE